MGCWGVFVICFTGFADVLRSGISEFLDSQRQSTRGCWRGLGGVFRYFSGILYLFGTFWCNAGGAGFDVSVRRYRGGC